MGGLGSGGGLFSPVNGRLEGITGGSEPGWGLENNSSCCCN